MLVVVVSLLVNWPVAWTLLRLMGSLDDQWVWFWMPISLTLGSLAALCIQARQVERANIASLDRH